MILRLKGSELLNMQYRNIESWSDLPIASYQGNETHDSVLEYVDDDPPLVRLKESSYKLLECCTFEYYYTEIQSQTEFDPARIKEFIANHNVMRGGNCTLMSNPEEFLAAGYHIVVLKSSDGQIIGTIFSRAHRIANITAGCTTFLVVHKNLRGMKIAMMLIKTMINFGLGSGIKAGYHIIDRIKSSCALSLKVFLRPIDVYATLRTRHQIPHDIMRTQQVAEYYDRDPDNIICDHSTFSDFLSLTNDHLNEIIWTPTQDELRSLSKNSSFHLRVVLSSDANPIGVFMLYVLEVSIAGEIVKCGWLMFMKALKDHRVEALEQIINYCKKLDLPYLLMHEIGDLSQDVLEEVLAYDTQTHDVLDWYNLHAPTELSQIHIPLL